MIGTQSQEQRAVSIHQTAEKGGVLGNPDSPGPNGPGPTGPYPPCIGPATSAIHRASDRDCLKRGCWGLVRYASMYEKALPDRSLRRRMGLLGDSSSHPERYWTTENP